MAFKRAENTRNDSEATRGCLSPSTLRRTGVKVGSAPENVGGAWVEKNSAKNDKQVRCIVDVEVVGACDKIALDVDTIGVTCPDRQPGRTTSNECSRLKPA
jgi:hypothetical protein